MDACGFETFTNPSDIRPLVAELTGFNVTPTNVPRTGLESAQLNDEVTELAVVFFGHALVGNSTDSRFVGLSPSSGHSADGVWKKIDKGLGALQIGGDFLGRGTQTRHITQ